MVASTARKSLGLGAGADKEVPVAKFVPYSSLANAYTVRLKNGQLVQTIKVKGFCHETASDEDITSLLETRASLLRGIKNAHLYGIYHHLIRRPINTYPRGEFASAWARQLDDDYKARIWESRAFVNEQYVTLVRRPAARVTKTFTKVVDLASKKADHAAHKAHEAAAIDEMTQVLQGIARSLAGYDPEVLSIRPIDPDDEAKGHVSDQLSFYGYLLNFDMRDVRLTGQDLSEILPRKRTSFGVETIESRGGRPRDRRVACVASIREYPECTAPGILDELMQVPHELILTQSFALTDKGSAVAHMKGVKRKMRRTPDASATLLGELDAAIDEVSAGNTLYGQHHLTLTVVAETPEDLDAGYAECDSALQNAAINLVREDANCEPAFWAMLPGNWAFISRKALVSAHNFAGFMSLHTFPTGQHRGLHWRQPITLLETTSGTPYWFNFHDGDVGNFTLIGPTGFGKTALLTFLIAQAQRVAPRTIYMDKDRGAEIFIRAIGGTYTTVREGVPTGLNPLQLPDTPSDRAFLKRWLASLAGRGGKRAVTQADEDVISEAVRSLYDVPVEQRRLSNLAILFEGHERGSSDSLAAALRPWHSDGDHAWLFDNEADQLSLDARTLGFDLTSILNLRELRAPWLNYVFHRIEGLIDGKPTIIMLDEGWKALDDPDFAERIKDWEKTIRKRGALIGFATQEVADIKDSDVGHTIIDQSLTKLFLGNPSAQESLYCDLFGLTPRELDLVKSWKKGRREVLIKHGNQSVVAKLDLGGLDQHLDILSARTSSIEVMEEAIAAHGENPDLWVPEFQRLMEATR